MDQPVYKRVLLKISGEALSGDKGTGLDFEVIGQVCDVIKEAPETPAARWSAPGPTTWACWPR